MGSKVRARAGLFLAAMAAASAVSGGCAEERDPINRVQIGAMPKSFFVGEKLDDKADDPEFYFRTTVVDVSAGAGSDSLITSSDAQPTTRIRWEITEDKLIGRLAYELIDDTDGRGKTGSTPMDAPKTDPAKDAKKGPAGPTSDGQVVASFKIQKHFDIRYSYNPETGEENNVVEENDHDRVWSQRQYMRVDWSTNLVTDAYDLDALSQLGLWGGVKWDPIAYNVNDPLDADAPVVDLQSGYFDITNKAYAAPEMVHDEEWGDFPACLLVGSFPRISCNPSEVKLRLSFRKVVDTDYEAADWDGRRMEMFGFFTNDRYGYDRRYGVVDDRWHRFASRWNIWEKSHNDTACATPETTPVGSDPHRDSDRDGTEDECQAVGNGSRCDDLRHLCTVPLRDRKVKTIPWHVNRDFPADLFDSESKVIEAWDNAIRVAVLSGRVAECRRAKGDGCDQMGWPEKWADDFVPPVGSSSLAEVPRIFVLCHNPVVTGDDPACGKEGTSPRLGDLRHNILTYITNPQAGAPWGIMVDAEDPLTGEKISGSVNMWGSTLDRAAAQLTDLVELLNGTTPPEQFIEGKDVSDWVRSMQSDATSQSKSALSTSELASRSAAFDPKAMAPFATYGKKAGAPAARRAARMKALASSGKLGAGNAAIAERIGRLRGGEIEAKMVTPDMVQAVGLNPKDPIGKTSIERATPFARNAPVFRRAFDRRAGMGRAKRHSCRREGPDTDHLVGLVKKAQKLFGTVDGKDAAKVKEHREKIYQWARENYSVGVFSHEFGHSMGLRHNFAGTFDSLNYDDEYWKLRTKNGSITKVCASGTTDGSGCIGPRYSDPLTNEEIDNGIGGYATSSVMDYPGDQALDMYPIGKYDKAALRFGYGGVVDVWNAPGVSVKGSGDGQRKAYELTAFDDSLGLFGVRWFSTPDSEDTKYIHYSQFQSEFGLIGATMDVVDYRDLEDFAAVPAYAEFATTPKAVDGKGRVRRGYLFSSDEYADSGNVPSFAYDAGADPYEQVRFLESAYEHRYVLDAFRRNRTQFNSWDVTSRVQAHYLDAIQQLSKTFAFAMVLDVDDPTNPPPQLLADGQYGPLALGTSVAFDMFTRMLTRPEPGSYCSTGNDACPGIQPYGLQDYIYVADPYPAPAATAYDFKVALGEGRYIHNDFDYNQGYWWSDYQKQVGSFYDKVWAVYYLSESFDSFISNSKEDFVDGRYKNVSFATVYPEQTRRLFAALLTNDIESYAPWAETSGGGAPSSAMTYPTWHDAAGLGPRPASPKIVDPAFGFEEQLYAMVWGTMFFPSAWTNQFIDDSRITALATEQISWPAAETYTFVDPVTGITYRAHTTGTEKLFGVDKQKSIGARMLDWANTLVYEAYLVDTDAEGFFLLNDDGTPKLTLKNGKPQLNPDYPGADAALRRYVSNIEVMRQLVRTFVRPLDDLSP